MADETDGGVGSRSRGVKGARESDGTRAPKPAAASVDNTSPWVGEFFLGVTAKEEFRQSSSSSHS